MELNSRAIGLLIGLLVSVITTAFLFLIDGINNTILLTAFFLSLSSTYILVWLVLEFLFFRHIDNISEGFDKINNTESQITDGLSNGTLLNPLKKINKEIFSYAENKQREIAELKKMEIFRREFMADVSHELKTPIFAAQGFVHTLLDGAIEDKKVRSKFLKKAAKSLDGLDILVHDLLTLSQIETGEIKMHIVPFNLIRTVEDVFDQLENKAIKKDIAFSYQKKEDLYVLGDQRRMYQVFLNLVSNAIKYTNKKGEVTIHFDEKDDHIATTVKDTGDGIPDKDINRIFERFYRVDKSRSKEKGGTGLGLAIVKHILEGHNTKMEVTSEVGVGSSFTFSLQKAKDRPIEEDEELYDE